MSTVGLELEWSDIDRWAKISPDLGAWNELDYTIVNSDGHANCPTGTTWRWGGEINTVPTYTANEQAAIVAALAAQLNPTINYRSNLHVHVKPDVDLEDLQLLKHVAMRMRESEGFVYTIVEPIPRPTRDEYEQDDDDAFRGAMKRYRRRLVSHHYSLPPARWLELVNSTTVDGFRDAHAPPTRNGRRAWHLAPRPGMNMRSLWKHGTIEFRHFPGTADPVEIESAVSWCQSFVDDVALGVTSALELYRSRSWRFPTFRKYDHELETRYQITKYK